MTEQFILAGVHLESQVCPSCGVTFALPEHMLQELRTHGRTYYCPNGHSLAFGTSEVDRLKKKLASAQARVTHLMDQNTSAERSNAALRGHLTRQRRRTAMGVCPCCDQTFSALGEHMKAEHPDYVSEGVN